MLVALGLAEGLEPKCEVISYEAPFGVGYLVAQLLSVPRGTEPLAVGSGSASSDIAADIPALARCAIETFVTAGEVIKPPSDLCALLEARAACFVSVKTHDGELRGCIGTFEPAKDTLAEELIDNAIGAATRDPRFPPVREAELPNLKYSVDVLSAPEPATMENLDPQIFGVIVEDENEIHRGLLLPNLEGIDTPTKQVEIASHKAGIRPGSQIKLWRFRSERYSE